MRIPFWIPSLWVAGSLLAWPDHLWLAILGYHSLCLVGSIRPGAWRSGRSSRIGWIVTGLCLLLLPLPFMLPALPGFPHAAISSILDQWPGGLWGHAVYALLVNVPVEEAYWRGAITRRHPDWSPLQHGAAFGLHHAAAAAILLPWPWIIPAFAGPAAAGALWTWLARKSEGIAFPILSHATADFALILLVARQLS
jgi:membrane protease YdiL (CAAX protease family)